MSVLVVCVVTGLVGYAFGYWLRGAFIRHETEDVRSEELSDAIELDVSFNNEVFDLVSEAFPDNIVEIVEEKPFPSYTKFVCVYDIPDSEILETERRIWDIINACKRDFNLDRRPLYTYVPSVHSHANTVRFYPMFLKTVEV